MTITPTGLLHRPETARRTVLDALYSIPLRRLRRIHRAAQRGAVPYADGTRCLAYRCLPWYKRALWIAAPLDEELENAYWWLGVDDPERQQQLLRLTSRVLTERASG